MPTIGAKPNPNPPSIAARLNRAMLRARVFNLLHAGLLGFCLGFMAGLVACRLLIGW